MKKCKFQRKGTHEGSEKGEEIPGWLEREWLCEWAGFETRQDLKDG